MKIALLGAAAALTALVVTPMADATVAPRRAEDLGRQLDRVEVLVERGRWKVARRQLLDLVARDEGREELVSRAREIRGLLQRCDFRLEVGEPDPEALVSGELVSHASRSGELKLRYRFDQKTNSSMFASAVGEQASFEDFANIDDVAVHAVEFCDEVTIEVRGFLPEEPPSGALVTAAPTILIGYGRDVSYRVCFGYPYTNTGSSSRWVAATIERVKGGGRRALVELGRKKTIRRGKSYKVKVTLSGNVIKASSGGSTCMKVKLPEEISAGRVALLNCLDVSEVVIEGDAPGFLERREERWTESRQAAFAKEWKPELPDWLLASIQDDGGEQDPASEEATSGKSEERGSDVSPASSLGGPRARR